MPEIVDVLNNDAFSTASMTGAVNQHSTNPSELLSSDLFVKTPVHSNVVGVEHRQGKFNIAAIDDRGDDIETSGDDDRTIRHFKTKRISKKVRIMASELQFLTQFGSNMQGAVESLQAHLARRIDGPTGLKAQCSNALELMQLGATQGKVVDRDGRVIWNFYNEFEIAPPPEIVLGLSSVDNGAYRKKIESTVTRPLRRRAQGLNAASPIALCGESFWDKKMANSEFRKTFETQQESSELRGATLGSEVKFAGVIWKEYFGSDAPSAIRVHDEKAILVPGGQTGMFEHVLSPAEGFDDLGTEGQDWYMYIDRDPSSRNAYIDVFLMTYPGMFNNRPDLVSILKAD